MKDTKLEGKERREGDSEEGMSSLRTRAMDDCDSTDGGTGNHTQPLNHFFSPLFHCLDILLLFSFVWFFFFCSWFLRRGLIIRSWLAQNLGRPDQLQTHRDLLASAFRCLALMPIHLSLIYLLIYLQIWSQCQHRLRSNKPLTRAAKIGNNTRRKHTGTWFRFLVYQITDGSDQV